MVKVTLKVKFADFELISGNRRVASSVVHRDELANVTPDQKKPSDCSACQSPDSQVKKPTIQRKKHCDCDARCGWSPLDRKEAGRSGEDAMG